MLTASTDGEEGWEAVEDPEAADGDGLDDPDEPLPPCCCCCFRSLKRCPLRPLLPDMDPVGAPATPSPAQRGAAQQLRAAAEEAILCFMGHAWRAAYATID